MSDIKKAGLLEFCKLYTSIELLPFQERLLHFEDETVGYGNSPSGHSYGSNPLPRNDEILHELREIKVLSQAKKEGR